MIERRALERIPINQLALVSFDGIRGVHPVTVRDISALGASISAPYYIFANEFKLSFDGFSSIFVCRVAWGDMMLCGVSFVSRPTSVWSLGGHAVSVRRKRCQPPFTAPAVNPATICRCANIVNSSTGNVTISAAAASGPQDS